MYDIFKEFDMIFNRFTRPVLDKSPYKIFKEEEQITIVINTLGFGKEDLKIEQEGTRLLVKGKKTLKEVDYTTTVDLGFDLGQFVPKIKEINFKVENGLTYVYIKLDQKEKPKIKISYKE